MVKVFPPLLHVLVAVIAIGLATTASSSREQSLSSDNNESNLVGIQEVNAEDLRRADAVADNEHHALVDGGLDGLFEEIELSNAEHDGSSGGISIEHCDAADRQPPHPRGCMAAKKNLRGSSNRKRVANSTPTSSKASAKQESKKTKKRFLRWAGEPETRHEGPEITTDVHEAVGNAASPDVGASASPLMADKNKMVKKRFLRWAGEQETHHAGALGNATSPDVGASASPLDKNRDAGTTTLARQIRGSPSAAVVSGEQETHHEGAIGKNETPPDVGASASPLDKKRDAGTALTRQIQSSPSVAVVSGEQETHHEGALGNNATPSDVGASASPLDKNRDAETTTLARQIRGSPSAAVVSGEQDTHHEGAIGKNATSPDVGASASPLDKTRDAGKTTLARQIRGSPSAAVVSD